MRSVLSPYELTHVQFVLLASLWWLEAHGDGAPMQARLADHAGTDAMMTSQVIRKLEARGLLERTPHPGDTRAMRVGLTDDGRTRVLAVLAAVEAADQEYFDALGDGRDAFVQSLVALRRGQP